MNFDKILKYVSPMDSENTVLLNCIKSSKKKTSEFDESQDENQEFDEEASCDEEAENQNLTLPDDRALSKFKFFSKESYFGNAIMRKDMATGPYIQLFAGNRKIYLKKLINFRIKHRNLRTGYK